MKTILLVDDDPLVLKVVERMLPRPCQDGQVTTARGGTEALQLARGAHFDLLITDIQMPPPDGLEVIREVHRLRPSMKIMAMSGVASLDEAGLCRSIQALGADVVLQKPFAAAELFEGVRGLLRDAHE